ncbi:MAG: ATP-dependent DNA helicase, partial [Luteimonas sp.]|nr:ATP-dependent DNA helicase [Luteimonas sp.]
ALPEAVASLRNVRKRAHDGAFVVVSAFDPLNLVGGILAGDKLPRQPGARLLLRDGVPLATLAGGEFRPLPALAEADLHAARVALLRDPSARLPADAVDA